MVNELNKTKKLLYTLYYRYNLRPYQLSYLLQSLRLPSKLEWEIIKKTSSTSKRIDSINNINLLSKEVENNFKEIKKYKDAGWVYERLPKEFDNYFKGKTIRE